MKKQITFWRLLFMACITLLVGCTNFVETDLPPSQLTGQAIFKDQATATAALANIYAGLRDLTLITGNTHGIGDLLGYYSDELDYYGSSIGFSYNFYDNNILATNSEVATLWNRSYNLIYACNSIFEGLKDNTSIELSGKEQLQGEALFLRSFIHFYLAQLFGNIPYVTETDYNINSKIGKLGTVETQERLVSDLEMAISLLSESYVVPGRIRVNQYVAKAFLARVQLYGGNWEASQSLCDEVLALTDLYIWEENLDQVFLKESKGTIWQLRPGSEGGNTYEALNFIFETGPPPKGALSQSFINSYSLNDQRMVQWVKSVTDGIDIWYHPYKYRIRGSSEKSMEHSVVIRLAELYLIRAEARMHLSDFVGAITDLNKIRSRAGLPDLEGLDAVDLEDAILQERRHELFTEFGHRWFDLKRFDKAGEVLGPIKPNWKENNLLFPIPQNELLTNPNLNPQNDGY